MNILLELKELLERLTRWKRIAQVPAKNIQNAK